LVAAVLLWLLGGCVDRKTEVEIFSTGGHIDLEVAGTTLSAPIAITALTGVEIRAMDSIDPPRGRRIEVSGVDGVIVDQSLPRRFRFPPGEVVPVGDWTLDERAAWGAVWRQPLDIGGAFTVKATFGGRFHHDLEIALHGDPGASVAVRRGLINNDVFIRAADGTTLAVTTIDPTPAADIAALAATMLRAAAVALFLIAIFAFFEPYSKPSPRAAATRRWRTAPWVILLAVLATVISGWVAGGVFEKLPHLPDSVTYLLQARWISSGALWGTVSTIQEHLDIPYTYTVGQRWLGHYPPGWPLLLSLGLAGNAPWLVSPLLGGIFIVLLYLAGRELDGPITGLLAAILGLVSPMARLIFGSMLSHAAAATCILAALWLVLIARRANAWIPAALSGIFLGLAFGVRPLSAVAAAIPLAAVVVGDLAARRRHEGSGLVAGFFLGGLAAALPTFAANQLITGNAFAFPYSLAKGPMYFAANLPFGIRNLETLIYSAGNGLHGWGWPAFHGPFWIALALGVAALPFFLRRHRTGDLLVAAMVVSIAVAVVGSRGHGLHGFGPRYLFEAFGFLFILSARGFVELARQTVDGRAVERRFHVAASALLFIVLGGSAMAALPHRLGLYHGYNGVDGSLERQIAAAQIERALVVLPPDDWTGWAMAARLIRPDPEAALLFIQADPDDPKIQDLAEGRPILIWSGRRLVPVSSRAKVERGDAVVEG
jgi:hypothetical protein